MLAGEIARYKCMLGYRLDTALRLLLLCCGNENVMPSFPFNVSVLNDHPDPPVPL